MDLRITLHKLDVLTQVVNQGGVGRAAEALYVAQPVVTAHIRALEERLGAKLFYREGRQVHLTEAGRTVYEWAEETLTRTREMDRYLGGLAEGNAGGVSLGASMSVGSYDLPRILVAYRKASPEVDLKLTISDTEHIVEDTRAGLHDFSLVVSAPDLEISGFTVTPIANDPIVLVSPPGSAPDADEIELDDLRELDFVEAPGGIMRRTFIDRELRALGLSDRRIVLELGHPEAMKLAVRDKIGVCFLFRSAARSELEQGTLREIAVSGVNMSLPVFLVHRKNKSFSPLQLDVIETIREQLSE